MKKITDLAQLAKQLETLTAMCKNCGTCQAACPLFPHTGMEKDIARGKIALLKGVMSEVVTSADTVLKRLDNCLVCGACKSVCPNRVDTLQIFLSARTLLAEYQGLSPAKKFFFRQVLARPWLFDALARMGTVAQPLLFKKSNTDGDTRSPRFVMSPLLSDRHVPPLAPASFRREWVAQEKDAVAAAPGKRVLFFTGCLIDKVYPRVAAAAIKSLRHHGFAPVLLENEACCGIPALSAGDGDGFSRLMGQNLEQIKTMEFDLLVTACATCAFTIKKVWPMMADKNSAQADLAEKIADRTKDITQVIAPLIAPPAGKTSADAVPVAYHDPCHLKKSLGIFKEPRLLIAANPAFRLTEMAAPDACCGMGGGFGITHYDMSKKIGESKKQNMLATGCRMVATTCPACMIQLSGLLADAGRADIAVCHVIELYAQSLE
ncbi:MAG: (Fe-S)-binding protein [Thermodesulfobacteriota bacterium]|nr:(Fe-S)-binding protein [Thermodesulfobacteriota bacterium]